MKKIIWPNIRGIILDMDGVVYKGNVGIKSAIRAIKIWKKKNIQVCFLTNNSTKNQSEFAKKLKSMGLEVNKNSIISTSLATSIYLKEKFKLKTKVYVVGSNSLKKYIYDEGFIFDENNAEVVVVGLDSNITYKKIHLASKLIRKGASFIATNPDKLYPSNKDFKPGAGTIIEAVRAASYNAKCFFIGKPNSYFVKTAIQYLRLEKKNIILIGDQLETDILAANNTKILSILVSTGLTNTNKIIKPSLTVNSLMELPISKI